MQDSMTLTTSEYWFVLQCKPNFEFIVADQLDGKKNKELSPNLDKASCQPASTPNKALFPGLFVCQRQAG